MGRAGAGRGGKPRSGGTAPRRTGGGHSMGRIGGGHSVKKPSSSGNRAGGGGFTKPSNRPNRSPGMPPPPPRAPRRPYFYSGRRHRGYSTYYGGGGGGGGCLTPVLILGFIIIGIVVAIGRSIPSKIAKNPPAFSSGNENTLKNSADNQEDAAAREKLDTGHAYINDCVIDELGWFDDVSKTESMLKYFWEKTGVQPYIILRDYDASLTSNSEKEQWAIDYYDNHFDTENIFLFVYFAEEDTDNDVGYMAYANGYETTSVMDSEAVEIFWNNIDNYWYTDLSTDDVLIRTFDDTADMIM